MPNINDLIGGYQHNKVDAIKKAIQAGADKEERDSMLRTPLINAVMDCKFEIIKLLIEFEAKINAQDINGKTALHFSTDCCDINILKYLLDQGANRKIPDKYGNTPLDCVYDDEYCDHTVIIDILENYPEM